MNAETYISNTERLLRNFGGHVEIVRSEKTNKWAAGFDRHYSQADLKSVLVGNVFNIDYFVSTKCTVSDIYRPTQRKTKLISAVRGLYGAKGATLDVLLAKLEEDGREALYQLLKVESDREVYKIQPYDAFVATIKGCDKGKYHVKEGLLIVPPEGAHLNFGLAFSRKPRRLDRGIPVPGLEDVYFID